MFGTKILIAALALAGTQAVSLQGELGQSREINLAQFTQTEEDLAIASFALPWVVDPIHLAQTDVQGGGLEELAQVATKYYK